MQVVYYAHSMLKYNTNVEHIEQDYIVKCFPGIQIINPGVFKYSDMSQYLSEVKKCNIVIFTEYKKHVGRGVYEEVQEAKRVGIPTFLLRDGIFYNVMLEIYNCDEWAVYFAKVVILSKILNIDIIRML